MIDEGPKQDELTDRKSWYGYKCKSAHRWIEHPIRDLIGATMRLPNQEMVNAVMLVGTGHQNRLAREWMIRIGNYSFECQKPGTMVPARTTADATGRSLQRWCSRQN